MAIKFFNIKTKEVRVAETEPLISALWASSDHSPNAHQGQDFGWRLAPEVVVEMRRIVNDPMALQNISVRYGRPLDDIGEKEILQFISDKTDQANAPVAQDADYSDEYNENIRRLEEERLKAEEKANAPATTVETTILGSGATAPQKPAPKTTTTTTTEQPEEPEEPEKEDDLTTTTTTEEKPTKES